MPGDDEAKGGTRSPWYRHGGPDWDTLRSRDDGGDNVVRFPGGCTGHDHPFPDESFEYWDDDDGYDLPPPQRLHSVVDTGRDLPRREGDDPGAPHPEPREGIRVRVARAFPVALMLIVRMPWTILSTSWGWADRRGMSRLLIVMATVGVLAILVVTLAGFDNGPVDPDGLAPLWTSRHQWMSGRIFPDPLPGPVTTSSPPAAAGMAADALPLPVGHRPPVHVAHTVGEVRAALDIPGNGFLLRPRVGGAGRIARTAAPTVPDLSRLPRVSMPTPASWLPAHVDGRRVARVGIRPYCRRGDACADDYPVSVRVTDVGFASRPDTLGHHAATALGLPWDGIRFTLPDGKPYEAMPWDLTVDASGRVAPAMATALALLAAASMAALSWAAGWAVERVLSRMADYSWDGTLPSLTFRFLAGLVTFAILRLALGHAGVASVVMDCTPLVLVPLTARTRGRLMAAAFLVSALALASSIPLDPPFAALAPGYGALGIGSWDVAGTMALAMVASLLVLAPGRRSLPVDVHVSTGRTPLVQDVRVVG